MDIDFPLVLVIAVFVTGIVALADKFYFASRRLAVVEGLKHDGASDEQIEAANKEGWLIETSKGFFSCLGACAGIALFLN